VPRPADDTVPLFASRRITMRVAEAFRGVSGPTIEVYTGAGDGDCGYAFEAGRSYVVYASNATGRFYTSICSRTRRLSEARQDLEYLRTFGRTPSATAVLRGIARRADPDPATGQFVESPFPGLSIRIEGQRVREQVRTRADGTFDTRVPAGTYALSVDAPDGLYALHPESVTIRDVRGCAEAYIDVRSDGRITGRVLDAHGTPLKGVEMQLLEVRDGARPGSPPDLYASEVHETVHSDAEGAYQFLRVEPGTYVIGIDSRTAGSQPWRRAWVMHPGTLRIEDATDVTIGVSERISVPDMVLPATVEFAVISGVIRDGMQRPVRNAMVSLSVPGASSSIATATTTADGGFQLPARVGVEYAIVANIYDAGRPRQTRVPLTVDSRTASIQIVLPD
jgi:hypothetical protein